MKKKIMYLAPEIPALSATFVYNEILELKKKGYDIDITSVHRPETPASEEVYNRLGKDIFYLYDQSLFYCFFVCIKTLIISPKNTVKSLMILLGDMIRVGIKSRNSLGLLYRYLYSFVLAPKIINQSIDHLHVHFAHVPSDIAMYSAILTNIPFSITGHANDLFERSWLLKEKVDRSQFFATISQYNKDFLIRLGCNKNKIKIIRCGIDTTAFNFRKLELDNKKIRIGSLGRLVEKKGFADLIKAVSLLKNNGALFEVEIAGDGPLKKKLANVVSELGLQDDVSLVGALSHDKVGEWLDSLDIFALACCEDENGDVDGIPVVLMEAMAKGVIVISTDVTGVKELVVNEKTGILVMPKDYEGLASAIITIAHESLEHKKVMVQAARKHVEKNFSIASNCEKLTQLFFM